MNAMSSTASQAYESFAPTTPSSPFAAPARMFAATLRAYTDPRNVTLEEVEVPAPAPGSVLIRVRAAGIHKGTVHLMSGTPYLVRAMGFGLTRPKQPIPGDECAGIVAALGDGVTEYAIGDHVFGITTGALAQYAVIKTEMLAPMPSGLSFVEAAALPISAGAAVHAFDKIDQPLDGASVLILGASGGVGAYAVQLAVHAGATVTAVCSGAKAGFVASLGAHEVLDYRKTDITQQARAFDAIVDIGGNRATRDMQRILADNGTLVYVGGSGGNWFGGIGRAVRGSLKSAFISQNLRMYFSEPDGADIADLASRVQRGELRATVDQTFSLADATDAFASLIAGMACGKLVVEIE